MWPELDQDCFCVYLCTYVIRTSSRRKKMQSAYAGTSMESTLRSLLQRQLPLVHNSKISTLFTLPARNNCNYDNVLQNRNSIGGSCRFEVAVKIRGRRRGNFTVEAKGKRSKMYKRMPPRPSIPPPEDDNPRFVLFVRSKKLPLWYPLSIITGGSTAKLMVAGKDTPIGKALFQSTLTRNIAAVVYKDEKSVRITATKRYPVLKAAAALEYGYKLIDPKDPNSAMNLKDIVTIPPQEELKPVVEKVKDFFGSTVKGMQESFGSISNLGNEENINPSEKNKSEAGTTS